MTTLNDWFISLSTAALLAFSTSGIAGLGFTYELSPKQVQLGERARLEIRLPLPPNFSGEISPVIRDELLYNSEDLLVLSKDQKKVSDDHIIWVYQLTAHKSGTITIPPIEIELLGQSYSTESATLSVSSSRAENDFALREDFGTVSLPVSRKKIFILLAILAVAGVLFYFRRKLLPRRPAQVPPDATLETKVDPYEKLRVELDRLKAMVENPQEKVRVADEWTRVIREFYAETTDNPAESWTTTELRSRFKRDEKALAILGFFSSCDKFRFSEKKVEADEVFLKNCITESERLLLPWQ